MISTRWGMVLVAGIAVTTLVGCGKPTYIEIEVHGTLAIPDEVNGLSLQLSSLQREEIWQEEFALQAPQTFPVTISFAPSDGTPKELFVKVDGLLGLQVVASVEATADWEEGLLNVARLPNLQPVTP